MSARLKKRRARSTGARPSGRGTSVRDVFEVLRERRRIAYTTVMGAMARLARKSLLRVEEDARHGPVRQRGPGRGEPDEPPTGVADPRSRRAEFSMIATSGRLCAAAAQTGGSKPTAASAMPMRL